MRTLLPHGSAVRSLFLYPMRAEKVGFAIDPNPLRFRLGSYTVPTQVLSLRERTFGKFASPSTDFPKVVGGSATKPELV
jgi:hypothetical protein